MPSRSQEEDMALLMEALRPYVGPADLDSLVLLERGQVLTLSFMCTIDLLASNGVPRAITKPPMEPRPMLA